VSIDKRDSCEIEITYKINSTEKVISMNNCEEVYLEDKQVYKLAMETLLTELGIDQSGKDYSEEEILEVVLQAAAKRSTIEAVVKNSEVAPSGNTVRGVIHQQLDLDNVEEKANSMLAKRLPKRLWKKARRGAIDLVHVPYHGEAQKEQTEIVRSQPKSGTTHFHAYATAFLVEKGKRFTLAITFVRSTDELTEILQRLQSRVKALKIRVKCWLLDREFYNVEVIRYMKQEKKNFIIPVIIRGKKNPPGGTRVLVTGKRSYWTTYTMKSQKSGAVSFRVAVVAKNWAGRFQRKGRRMLAYAVYGINAQLKDIAEIYRSRFGIETSYRQMNQARGRTTSRSPVLRMLFVAIAFMLRNLWAYLHWAVVALPCQRIRHIRSTVFSLEQMLDWISNICKHHLGSAFKLSVGYPLEV
jgi:Transposase DDE domain